MKKIYFLPLFFLLLIFATKECYSQFIQVEMSTRLHNALRTAKQTDKIKVLVLLKDRVDIETLDKNLYASRTDINERARIVITELMLKASSTQGPLISYLQEQLTQNKVTYYESFWISNLISFEATPEVINQVASRMDIEQIDIDAILEYDKPVYEGPAPEQTESSEIGLRVINAHKLWEMGITGAGRIVMNIDTGVDRNHPALSSRWRGNSVPWYHAWMDKNGNTTQPTDCESHGTHTMGIMCGRSGTDTVGVAPDAQWIAARTICSSPHTSNSIAAFQWAMNPDSNITTNDMPDAIGNSWHDPGLANECTSIYVSTLNALEAAGIAVVFSCGNAGPGVSTITKPKNVNTNLVNTFSVGNIDGNQPFPYPISSSSSRGPSLCGGTGSLLIKPEVVAPGTNVRSTIPGGGFGNKSGTSMACPHIVGAVALLKQYAPNLTGKQILEALYNTAVDLGSAGEDNTFGMGVINVLAAYQSLGPAIVHNQLPNTENVTGPYAVNCVITPSGSPIDPSKTRLLWSRNNPSITDSLLLTNTGGNNWTGNIPGNGTPATYRYYIKTTDMLNRTTTAPAGAPANLYSFTAGPDNIKPVITHTALPNTPKNSWPATVNAVVTDNYGIDSAWVRWYKNNTGTGIKHFKLTNTGGNNFSAAFNSDTSQVAFNDSIYYRIIAQDNSSNHNKDSTVLYSFKIVAIANGCVGNGTTGVAWPFNTYWHDSRTQMLYTSSEILAGGGAIGQITKIGFNVTTAASQTMNGFSVKMQNTTMTSVTSFTTTGWTNVYTGTYTVPGTGWRFIDLQTPFPWNGQNLLVEICFDNTSYTSATNVAATSASGMCREQHTDNAAGCSFTAGTNQTNRPNVCLTINLMVGNQTVSSIVPNTFSLAQNYPNPFNPSTVIKYSVPKQSLVKMIIYDVTGREVKTLVNEIKQAGNYEAVFDGTSLASGVYFYRMTSGDFVDVRKMVLVK
jgi:subtilisin family serine protease